MSSLNHDNYDISHRDLIDDAREQLRDNWMTAIIICLILFVSSTVLFALSIFVSGALMVGMSRFSLNIARGEYTEVSNLFEGFNNYIPTLAAYFIILVLVSLGTACFLIPGIILGIGFSQTFYILADNEELTGIEAIRKSWDMMVGHKMDYFMLMIRFIP